ncbi:MAG TPA: NUDIX domain-containing protein [bacterium]|nr:NUDIX domain-containing protein [bacterium]
MITTPRLGRVAALLVKDGAVALVERQLPDELYYLFPGGAVEAGETPEAAVVREVHEELGLVVTVDRLVAEVAHRGQVQYYYAVTISGGTFGTGRGAEIGTVDPEHGSYLARWIPIGVLASLPVHPKGVAGLVAAFPRRGWPARPLRLEDPGRQQSR